MGGLINTAVEIYDLSDSGCFIKTAERSPAAGQQFVLKIRLPGQGWICVKGQTVYGKPDVGYAVSFLDMPPEASDRLQRELIRLRGLLPEEDQGRGAMLPICPRCRSSAVRPVGMAGSTLPWFTCEECAFVWAARGPTEDEPALAPESLPTRPGGRKRVLIVDDDGGVLRVLAQALSDYHVLTARDVAEGGTLGFTARPHLLIADYLMPDGTGEELISRLRERHADLKVLFVTGHGRMLEDEGPTWWRNEQCLTKPFSIADLRRAVNGLIGPP